MKIFRIEERETGEGVYQNMLSYLIIDRWACRIGLENAKHPAPCKDAKLWANLSKVRTEDYVFGFSSLDQCKKWFYDPILLEHLAFAGMVLNVYDVKNYFEGFTQAVFLKSEHVKNKIVETISLEKI
jgi:hypothetical protein